MKHIRLLCALCLLLALTLSTALAEFDAVPKSRIAFTMPDGLSAQTDISDGQLSVSIDTADTNWEKLLSNSYDADMSTIILPLRISAPEGAGAVACEIAQYNPGNPPPDLDAYFEDQISGPQPQAGTSARWFLDVARYTESSGMMQPVTTYTDMNCTLLCRWYDQAQGSKTVIRTEQLKLSVTFTSSAMFKVERKQVATSDIKAGLVRKKNAAFETLDESVLTTTVTDGSVVYEIADVSAVDSAYEGNLYTVIAVPQALVESGVLKKGAWCRNTHMGNTSDMTIKGDAATGYYIELPLPIPSKNGQTESSSFSLSFGYEDTTADFGSLSIRLITGDPLPWPAYVTAWTTVPMARMDLTKYDSLQSSMDITYDRDTGILHYGMQEDTLPDVQEIESVNWKPVVAVPEGAAAYSNWRISASELYGSQLTAEYQAEMEAQLAKAQNRKAVPDGASTVTLDGSSLFIAYHPSSDGVDSAEAQETLAEQTVYLPGDMTGEYAGAAQVIFWYASEDATEPFLMEYMIDTRDAFALVQESEAQLTLGESVTVPVFLIDSAHNKTNCYLIINTYPQEDGSYIYYELQLIHRTADGDVPVSLDPDLTYRLCIPYPEGYSKNSEDVTFIIRHLNSTHEVTEIFDEEGYGGIERTDEGLVITIKSLSPFEIIWYTPEAAADPSALPQTGDHSRMLLWLALACGSIALLTANKKRLKA